MLRAGIIGLGVGEQHIAGFTSHRDAAVVALCDRDAVKLAAIGQKYPGMKLYSDAEALLDDPEINVVSIASYDHEHGDQVIRALRNGKHVFVEKPMCLTETDLSGIRKELRGHPGLRLSTNTILRQSPRFRWLKRQIAAGALGALYLAETDYVYGRLNKLTEGWRGRIPGYSVMLGGGVHMVDLLLWLTGERPVEVYAAGNGICSAGSGFHGNDMVAALMRFPDGLIAKVTANFGSVHPHFHRVLLYGTGGTFENPPEDPNGPARLWRSRDPGTPPEAIDEAYAPPSKGLLIPSFLDAICGNGASEVGEDDVFAALSVCLAIDRSLADKQPAAVRYL